jgi:hypothetical protein
LRRAEAGGLQLMERRSGRRTETTWGGWEDGRMGGWEGPTPPNFKSVLERNGRRKVN